MSFNANGFCDNAETGAALLIGGAYLAAKRAQARDSWTAEDDSAAHAAWLARRHAKDRYLVALKLDAHRKAKATACALRWAQALREGRGE